MEYARSLDAEMAAALARHREIAAGLPDRYVIPFPQAREQLVFERRWWIEGAPQMASVREETIDCEGRGVRLRRYRPADAKAGSIVYLHGGGWCVGCNDTHDNVLRHLAAAGHEVIGVDYSLAPEHPFPCAVHDTAAVADLADTAGPVVLAGDSAGANLALVEAMRRRDAGRSMPAGLVLFYGTYGPVRREGSGAAYGSGEFGLSIAALDRYANAYLGDPSVEDPHAYPLLGRLDGLPATWLAAAQLDPLLDDTLDLATLLAQAGNRCTLEVFPGVVHGFLSYARMVGSARRALQAAGTYAARALAGSDA